jgi:hypothetical protein
MRDAVTTAEPMVVVTIVPRPKAIISAPRKPESGLSGPSERLPAGLKRPFRLASRSTKITPGHMERFLRRLGISGKAYRRWTGGQSFGEFIEENPTWSLRAWQTLVVENLETFQAITRSGGYRHGC